MRDLWFYNWLSRFGFMNYRAKIMVMAFIGTHIPLIALASYLAFQSAPDWSTFFTTIGITLVATLVGTGLTLFVLNELLKPVLKTSRALRAYRETRTPGALPTHYTDEVGTLMADADKTIAHLETVRDTLEHVDATTGLANRKRLLQIMEARAAKDTAFAIVAMRVANMPRLTEALDAEQAEEAMTMLARRLESALPDSGVLARTGQGEFTVLLFDPESGAIVDALRRATDGEIALSGLAIDPQVYCGVATYPDDAVDAVKLLDEAVSAAASAGPSLPVAHHSPQTRAAAVERLQIEQDLRRAIDRNEFRLHYQPVVDLAAGRATGAEALIRWQHPERGLMAPNAFIPAAETSGLIDPIGLWVMRQACAQLSEWNAQGRDGLKVAINLSARQFLDPDLGRHVAEALETARIAPSQLEIELTETAAMADFDHTRRVFTMLRDLGVSIAIDDFGTGYASMSNLRKLPFDKLKIDREFVTDVYKNRDGQAICGALVTLSKGIGLDVLAEGAETEEEVRYLNGLGCDLFQGYFFAKPAPAEEFAAGIDAMALRSVLEKMTPQNSEGTVSAKAG